LLGRFIPQISHNHITYTVKAYKVMNIYQICMWYKDKAILRFPAAINVKVPMRLVNVLKVSEKVMQLN